DNLEDVKNEDEKGITVKKSENFSEWYTQAIIKSGFADYSDVSGIIILKPDAYFVWQSITNVVDAELKRDGVEDVYFPIFIPERFLNKEKEHVEGFSPEVAWVTEAGNSKLSERLAVRPTSETIMYPSYSKWIRSWRDLPLRYNQWNNVVRWEFKHPTPFIRSREFLWNEGHTVYATSEEADKERDFILNLYLKTLKDHLALPGIPGQKTDKEKFAGGVNSYSIEHILPDGWAIQGPDFHSDGQNFAKAFDIKFLDKDGKMEYAWQNTYAITTRMLGVMVAMHGDDKGLIIPPRVARIQVIIVPITKKDNFAKVKEACENALGVLDKQRARIDYREGYSPGYKFNEWELKGVPLRIEVGSREAEKNTAVLVRRDTGEKIEVALSDLAAKVAETLDSIQHDLYKKAEEMMNASIHTATDYEEMKKILESSKGMIHAPWCGDINCENKIKEETGAKITNMPFDQGEKGEKCIYCKRKAKAMANFARSY
ncbi:proline--tRNA ligase, partial [Candidatus Marsarchaeota archaeon]|nr:proline--tRNA ligase [Candidatus Marsarchaeota archaeon]